MQARLQAEIEREEANLARSQMRLENLRKAAGGDLRHQSMMRTNKSASVKQWFLTFSANIMRSQDEERDAIPFNRITLRGLSIDALWETRGVTKQDGRLPQQWLCTFLKDQR